MECIERQDGDKYMNHSIKPFHTKSNSKNSSAYLGATKFIEIIQDNGIGAAVSYLDRS
jgi:hypothetical protein